MCVRLLLASFFFFWPRIRNDDEVEVEVSLRRIALAVAVTARVV